MTRNTTQKKPKSTTKNLSVTAHNFVVHELACRPYQIYCELFEIIKPRQNRKILMPKTVTFDVVKDLTNEDQETFYFFDDFASVGLIQNQQTIVIRQLALTDIDIRRRAWAYLLNAFLALKPINPTIYQAIKSSMPNEIAKEIFEDELTIANVLKELGLDRHHYDYQARLQQSKKPHALPLFVDLIAEEMQNEA